MVTGRVLLIAGSDSSGGAGLEAGQKVLASHGCYAMTATTALTAQNTMGVHALHPIPSSFVECQIEACLNDVGADVVTTGMLAAADTIEAVSRQLKKHKVPILVVDPVMVSTSGSELLPHDAIQGLCRHLFPLTTILTPNIPEARLILDANPPPSQTACARNGRDIESVSDIEIIGRRIQTLGPKWVLVKGGHLPFRRDMRVASTESEMDLVVDVLLGPNGFVLRVESPWQQSTSTHGTGCSLAAAIASGLANGRDVPTSVLAACRYVEAGIRTAPGLGDGHGPLDHFHSTYTLPFSSGYFVEYLLERSDVSDVWKPFVHHQFVKALGDGTLPLESFKGYIIQDYLFLTHFARANALASYKAKNVDDIVVVNISCRATTSLSPPRLKLVEDHGLPIS
ncbi:hypothetical protein RJ55_07616 [Drechmeria coniospora]|nr:hypothetical protein RJ55_07616 [Drechmeria coniospora]